jgi:hypothetical protein
MSRLPYPIDPELVAVAVAYENEMLIADQVLPRVPVGKEEFKYFKYPKGSFFTLPDNKVGRKGQPTEVNFEASEETASTDDYGLDDPIPQSDIDNAPENYDPVAQSVEGLRNLNMLAREKRAADLVFDAGQYGSKNKAQLSGTSQWDNEDSTPIDDIEEALDGCIMRPNKLVIGQAPWSKLRRHPKINKAINANAGDVGLAGPAAVASIFDLEDVWVGQGWINAAKPGQTPNFKRVWGKNAALLYQDSTATNRQGTTFGFTAQFGDQIAGQQPDSDIGLQGGVRVRQGEKVKELITANDLGYLLEDVIS